MNINETVHTVYVIDTAELLEFLTTPCHTLMDPATELSFQANRDGDTFTMMSPIRSNISA